MKRVLSTADYSTTLNFGVLLLAEIDHVMQQCLSSAGTYQRIVPVYDNFHSNCALHNKNNRDLLSQALCVIGSLGNLMFKLIVPSTEELYCLNSDSDFYTLIPDRSDLHFAETYLYERNIATYPRMLCNNARNATWS